MSTSPTANSRMSLLARSRNSPTEKVSIETPMMANSSGSNLPLQRLYMAGISMRLVRSPPAPKMTIAQGPAGLPKVSCVSFPESVGATRRTSEGLQKAPICVTGRCDAHPLFAITSEAFYSYDVSIRFAGPLDGNSLPTLGTRATETRTEVRRGLSRGVSVRETCERPVTFYKSFHASILIHERGSARARVCGLSYVGQVAGSVFWKWDLVCDVTADSKIGNPREVQ